MSDIPLSLQGLLGVAMDKTQPQVETILATLKPDIVFFDFATWLPAITRPLGAKSICFSVINAATYALFLVPARKMAPDMNLEEPLQPPPGYPSSNVVIRAKDAPYIAPANSVSPILSIFKRVTGCFQECDAIAFRSYQEKERVYFDYVSQQYSKPVLLKRHLLPKTSASQLEEKYDKWLNKFKPGSIVYCAFGSQITLDLKQLQELVLGFELRGLPFLVALKPPEGFSTIEEALPEGFE
ncbi:hypothetical protein Pint_04652 [Pistacia integerrima]|uniref:Uncharacterized protein n=1 Tax=Pistacia integerrima TaxID=434235 RepID=A0ACC0Z5W5_9ROSI|nr:hypothetical protein Pint_04652 [Pistacia integerrima]